MTTIQEIYEEYRIMPNLQLHMLRTAAVASLICDNFSESLPKEEILTAALLHDMGNIIKSNFEIMPELLQPEGKEYWQKVKEEYIEKYGTNEHEASVRIAEDIGLSRNLIQLIDNNRFSLLCELRDSSDWVGKIVKYSDLRAAPFGIVSYEERMADLKKRYSGVKAKARKYDHSPLMLCGKEIEKQIFEKCTLRAEDITDDAIAPLIPELRKFVIK